MSISPARRAAFDCLSLIAEKKEFSSSVLPRFEAGLNRMDRALCHQIVLGVLRTQIYLDRLIDDFSGSKRIDTPVRIAARMGLYQLQFLDRVPQHSIVNDSVNLVARAGKTSAKGFLNALLRRAGRRRFRPGFERDIERISFETSHPVWLIERWSAQFGPVEAEAIASAHNEPGAAAFRLTGRTTAESRELISRFRRSESVPGCFFADSEIEKVRRLADAGEVYFQDEASQLTGLSFSAGIGKGKSRVIDLCAAPGGKTAQVFVFRPEAFILAADRSQKRLSFMRRNLAKQGAEGVLFTRLDAEQELPFAENSFDAVFVDAPCTGTGTIRHNPEIRYFVTPDDIRVKHWKQRAILENASKIVREGGLLQYSTCSLETEENEGVIREFLSRNGKFEIERPNVPENFITPEGFARTFPHRDRMDGFFIAALRKKSPGPNRRIL